MTRDRQALYLFLQARISKETDYEFDHLPQLFREEGFKTPRPLAS